MSCPESPWWPSVITWLTVFGGWFVVHRASLYRERRKEKRDSARILLEDLACLERKAIAFHTSNHYDSHVAAELRQETERIVRRLQRLSLSELNIQIGLMVRLRRSITLQNADASNFAPQGADGQLICGIRAAIDDLTASVEVAKETYWA